MSVRRIFEILETEPTDDQKAIKKAYAKLVKNIIRKNILRSGKKFMMPMKKQLRGHSGANRIFRLFL